MASELLFKFLNGLPDRNYDTSTEFVYQNIAEFLDILQYDPDNIFYELSSRYKVDPVHLDEDMASRDGDVYRFTQADAGVARSTSSRPYMLIEAKYSEELPPGEDVGVYNHVLSEELGVQADAFNPVLSIYLTNYSLLILHDNGGSSYDLRDISMSDATEIFEILQAPEELPQEIAPSIRSAEISSIQTEYFQLDTVEGSVESLDGIGIGR
ncbi:hypothetical protein GOC74_11230 [Halomicrobium mukohataei]|uniref:Uncharacterized protein n=1 Tax=Halomicrobium mukohataei TaxID=57705 RepID=A0A847UG13_9EURY|nr:hypothetical protein [Halomicrobium mukohataei]NLV10500.1 hypothetical protein [Halomicrobium mukohataei]